MAKQTTKKANAKPTKAARAEKAKAPAPVEHEDAHEDAHEDVHEYAHEDVHEYAHEAVARLNSSAQAKAGYVNRLYNVEREFADAKEQRAEFVRELKAEIKSNFDKTGVEMKEVIRLAKIRLDEANIRADHILRAMDFETYEALFGAPRSQEIDGLD